MPFRTHVHVDSDFAPNTPALLLVSGGPGASSWLWEPLASLRRYFPVVTVDVPGSAGLADEVGSHSFESVVEGLENAASALPFKSYVAVGFSFGGLFAAALALRGRLNVCGWAGVASPLSPRGFALSEANFRPKLTPAMQAAEAAVVAAPSGATFRGLLRSLVPLYFRPENQAAGDRFLAEESPNGVLFLQVYGAMLQGKLPELLPGLRALSVPKVLIAGETDGMIPVAALRLDAVDAGADFVALPCSHFVNFEQPDAVAATLKRLFT